MADKQYVEVAGRRIAYVEAGGGDPIVFLHGNPTSSYLWRNVIPHCEGVGRCLAPDLIGMGDSDKLDDSGPGSYRFVQHREFVDGFLEAVGATDRVSFVIHDWGSALGFHWAHRHPDAVRGIAYMEAILRPISWSEFPEAAAGVFQGFRSPAGEEMVLQNNVFVEAVLPGSIMRQLGDEEMAEYRRPFVEPGESRRPTLTWPREIPIDGEPADVHEIVAAYSEWLGTSEIPKLFVHAEPGALIQGPTLDFARTFPNQTEVTVPGIHFVQEDSPDEIGKAVAAFVAGLD